MIDLTKIKQVYLLGIGGIGMSALARYFKHFGYEVSGYDRTPSFLISQLEMEGIPVHFDDRSDDLLKLLDPENTLVIYTPAVPKDWGEREFLSRHGYFLHKRSEVLGMLCDQLKCAAVAGTHGKTSVSTMLTHLFHGSPFHCNAFLGGISKNYETNLLLDVNSDWIVAEADEYDRSFLHLHPNMAVITSMDADHLDIYGTHANLIDCFGQFAEQVNSEGVLLLKKGLQFSKLTKPLAKIYTYSLEGPADYYAENIQRDAGSYCFDLIGPDIRINQLRLAYPGLMNVENAIAATAMALNAGIDEKYIREGLESYLGVKRRFDIRLTTDKYLVIDDYAHHPRELEATISSVRHLYPNKKITGIFQPHLYSRTADFYQGFAASLSLLDRVILLDIYPARELPVEGVSSKLIYDQISIADKQIYSKDKLVKEAENFDPGIILFMGAGDIDRLVEPVCNRMQKIDE